MSKTGPLYFPNNPTFFVTCPKCQHSAPWDTVVQSNVLKLITIRCPVCDRLEERKPDGTSRVITEGTLR